MEGKPVARLDRFLVEELVDETLVYDQDRDCAHCLNATAAFVWEHADGTRDVAEMTRLLSKASGEAASEEVVRLALERLQRANLLEHGLAEEVSSPPEEEKEDRRQALRRMAKMGVALPMVMTLAIPSALQAATQIAGIDCWRYPEENRGKCCTNGRTCIQWGRIGLCIGQRC